MKSEHLHRSRSTRAPPTQRDGRRGRRRAPTPGQTRQRAFPSAASLPRRRKPRRGRYRRGVASQPRTRLPANRIPRRRGNTGFTPPRRRALKAARGRPPSCPAHPAAQSNAVQGPTHTEGRRGGAATAGIKRQPVPPLSPPPHARRPRL